MSDEGEESSITSDDVLDDPGVVSANTSTPHSKHSVKNTSQQHCPVTTKESYRSRYAKFDTTAIHLNDTKNLIPYIDPKPEKWDYQMPYVFRLPPKAMGNKTVKATTKCPPFHILLDHAIAVVWSLYSEEETNIPLGINQLHWAYNFLATIKDNEHKHSKDITHCLNTIMDDLIQQYAALSEDVHTADSLEGFQPLASSSPLDSPSNSQSNSKCTCAAKSKESKHSVESAADLDYPFSVNYLDMSLHNKTDKFNENISLNKMTINTTHSVSQKESRNTNAATQQGRIENEDVGALLHKWRNEQFSRLLDDLNELQAIEKYLDHRSLTDEEIQNFLVKRIGGPKCQPKHDK